MSDITGLNDEFEIPSRFQYGLLYKLRQEAFKNPKALMAGFGEAATMARLDWETFLINAESKTKIRTRGPGQVRYGGF